MRLGADNMALVVHCERRGDGARVWTGGRIGRVRLHECTARCTLAIKTVSGGELVNKQAHQALRILLADQDPGALKVTAAQVRELGHTPTEIAVELREAAEAIARDDPDLTLVVLYGDDRHALDLIEEINAYSSGPVIALLDREDPEFVAEAAERGIFAYARQETSDSIQSAIEVAMRRWREKHELAEQIERLEGALQRRALIERAKGILMERHSIDDRAGFELLREHARSHNRTVVDVAAAVAEGHALLRKGRD
jgi:AmiR/NasT family two-component response regulator